MKKIIFYLPSLLPSGGIERVVSTVANEMTQYYDVSVLTKDTTCSFYPLNNKVKHYCLGLKTQLNMNKRLVRFFQTAYSLIYSVFCLNRNLAKMDYDYIYVTHPISRLELLLCGVEAKKIIISEHGASNNYNSIYRMLRKLTYKKCNSYILPTTLDYAFYKNLGFPVVYIPHFKPSLKYSLGRERKKVVLNVGRLTEDKKQLTLLQIWNDLPNELREKWELHIVGTGELQGELNCFIDKYSLGSSVKLLPPSKNIERYYSQSSIFALASRSEGFGMVLLEAAGFGLPLISFDCPSGPRDIISQENGFLIEDNNDSEYLKKLEILMSNDSLRESLSRGSLEFVRNWSNEDITKQWRDVFL